MSNSIFPTLPGMAWGLTRTPVWQTRRQQSVSGKVTTQADWTYPIRKYQLSFEFLRSGAGMAELQTLTGFFNSLSGGCDTFLFVDPEDSYATSQPIGVTDGVTTSWQLVRTYGGFTEPVTQAGYVASVTLNGVPFTGYTLGPNGILTLGAQAAGQTIEVNSWTEILTNQMPRDYYQSACRHVLFDAKCGIPKNTVQYEVPIVGLPTANGFYVGNPGPFPANWFQLGTLVMQTGPAITQARSVASSSVETDQGMLILLTTPLTLAPAIGDVLALYPGCDKTYATCQNKFGNLARFGGFPFIPAPETAV
jgi:uncharacterized protein (TIGR02217 family)